MSRSDPPIWVRIAAAGLLFVASWWLLNTEVLRGLVGDSVAAIALTIVAAPVLRGMHLPLGTWPDGPWRNQFRMRAVVLTALAIAVALLAARPGMTESLASSIDVGTGVLTIAGAVTWGIGIAMVRQRSYMRWYALAALLAIVPLVVATAWETWQGSGVAVERLCFWQAGPDGADGASTACDAAVFPAFLFLLGVSLPSMLVVEELAFRRLLIGCARQVGLLWVVGAAVVATAWYWLLTQSAVHGAPVVLLGGLGALCAGCIYVLSRSLMVSAVFSSVLFASHDAIRLGRAAGGAADQTELLPVTLWVPLLLIGVALSLVVARRHGFVGRYLDR